MEEALSLSQFKQGKLDEQGNYRSLNQCKQNGKNDEQEDKKAANADNMTLWKVCLSEQIKLHTFNDITGTASKVISWLLHDSP